MTDVVLRPPGVVGEVAAWIDACAVVPQPDLSLGAALAVVGTVLGRRWETDGECRAVLHVVGVAGPGSGKEVARQCAARLLDSIGMSRRVGSDGWASASGLRAELISCPTRLWLPDELGRALQAYGSHGAGSHERQIVDELLKVWGASAGTMLGKAYAEREAQRIEAPHGCLYGTTTPGSLWRALRGTDVVDGLLSRWLCVVVDHAPPAPVVPTSSPRTPPAALVAALKVLARGPDDGSDLAHLDAPDVRPRALRVPLDASALEGLREVGERVRRQKLSGDERIAALWARAREHALRVALAVAVGRGAGVVEHSDVLWSWAWVRARLRRLEDAVLTEVAEDEQQRCQGAIMRALKDGPRARREITRATQRHPARVRAEALQTLCDTGQIRVTPGRAGVTPDTYELVVDA